MKCKSDLVENQPPSSGESAVSAHAPSDKNEEAITKMLDICDTNNIDVDEKTRHALRLDQTHTPPMTSIRRPFSKRETIIGSLVRNRQLERNEPSPEADIIREIDQTVGAAANRTFPFEVRIRDGSYSVKSPVASSGEKVGQQFIPTVTNSGILYRMAQSYKRTTETKSIMEGINLFLEGGKMYLILGAPGSGKSTCK